MEGVTEILIGRHVAVEVLKHTCNEMKHRQQVEKCVEVLILISIFVIIQRFFGLLYAFSRPSADILVIPYDFFLNLLSA
jgi:hypothetical protein